jgi:hypothetical protein
MGNTGAVACRIYIQCSHMNAHDKQDAIRPILAYNYFNIIILDTRIFCCYDFKYRKF